MSLLYLAFEVVAANFPDVVLLAPGCMTLHDALLLEPGDRTLHDALLLAPGCMT